MPNDKTQLDKYDGPDNVLTPQHYVDALNSQSACNAVALIHALGPVRDAVVEEGHARTKCSLTAWWAEHPILVLYITQLAYLTLGMTGSHDQYSRAYHYCCQRARADGPPVFASVTPEAEPVAAAA